MDNSSTYADIGGLGSVEAVRMAVEDFRGTVLGRKIEVVFIVTGTMDGLANNLSAGAGTQDAA